MALYRTQNLLLMITSVSFKPGIVKMSDGSRDDDKTYHDYIPVGLCRYGPVKS